MSPPNPIPGFLKQWRLQAYFLSLDSPDFDRLHEALAEPREHQVVRGSVFVWFPRAAGKEMIAKNREKKRKEGQGGRAVAIAQSSNTQNGTHQCIHPVGGLRQNLHGSSSLQFWRFNYGTSFFIAAYTFEAQSYSARSSCLPCPRLEWQINY